MPLRVVKVGGSLFDLPDLPDRVSAWLAEQSSAHHIFITGGGAFVEQVRHAHQSRPLTDEAAHWICVDLMSVTARMFHDWLPQAELIDDGSLLLLRTNQPGTTIFDPSRWMRLQEPTLVGQSLPQSWDVTSDSIAARVAIAYSADELVLMKSALPRTSARLQELADCGYVDAMLPRLAEELPPLSLVGLRNGGSLVVGGPKDQAQHDSP